MAAGTIKINRETSASPLKIVVAPAIDPRNASIVWIHVNGYKFKAGKAQLVTKIDDGSTHIWVDTYYKKTSHAFLTLLRRAGLVEHEFGKFQIS